METGLEVSDGYRSTLQGWHCPAVLFPSSDIALVVGLRACMASYEGPERTKILVLRRHIYVFGVVTYVFLFKGVLITE